MCGSQGPVDSLDFKAQTYTLDSDNVFTLASYYEAHSAWVNMYAPLRPSWRTYILEYGERVPEPTNVKVSLLSIPYMRSARR